MKNVFKNLIKIAAVAAVVFFGAPFLAVLAGGFIALKGVDVISTVARGVRMRRSGLSPEVDSEQMKHNEAVHRVNSRKQFFDFRNGQWNVHALPLDMYPSVGMFDSGEALFTCCGLENVIKGSVTRDALGRQKARFTMEIRDEKKAQDVADAIARNGIVGTKVLRKDSESFLLVSDNAVDISTLVKQFYPPRTFEVAREVTTTRQFVVGGCGSYEEALKEFQENRHRYSRPENVVVSTQNFIDGHAEPKVTSVPVYSPDSLPLGSYVINETTTDYYSKNVSVNGGVDMTDEAMRSDAAAAVVFKPEDKVEDRCSFEPKYSNGLDGKVPSRTISLDGNPVEVMFKGSPRLSQTGAAMYVSFSSQEALLDVLSGKSPLRGRMVLVDKERPEVGQGGFLLELPADERLVSSLRLRGDEAADMSERLQHLDVSYEDVMRTLVCRELDGSGYVSAVLAEEPDLSRAVVHGVPAEDYRMRMRDLVEQGKVDALKTQEESKLWLEEAAKIKSVQMDLDFRNKELVLTSFVQIKDTVEMKTECRKLTMDQLEELSSRGVLSQGEMKDLLMRLHPDVFNMYSDSRGRSVFADPIADFIDGRKPRVVKKRSEEKKQEKELKTEPRKEVRSAARKKKSSTPKVG